MDIDLRFILGVFSFCLGACIASFLNVVIWRVPRDESIVSPPSHCPKCNAPIRWYQNLPILSWLALRGKCANCEASISPRYILIESLGGILFLAAFLRYGTYPDWVSVVHVLVMWIWIAFMIVGSFIDFDYQLLPDFTTVGGMFLGLALAISDAVARGNMRPILWSASGVAFGFGLLWLVRFFGTRAFRREAMGLGDVFLMGAVGALFGPVAVVVTLILSSVIGSVVGIGLMFASRIRLGKFVAIPYGPYICLGCIAWMFYGPEMVKWYVHLLQG